MNGYEIFGIKLQSPFIIGSGPLSFSGEAMVRLHQACAGAVVTKTIRLEPAINPVPHMLNAGTGTLINCEKWADLPAEQWIEKEIPLAKKQGVIVIASVGHTLAESSQLVEKLAGAGADMIELVSYDEKDLAPMAADAKKRINIPVLVKLSPNQSNLVQTAGECLAVGADGLTACDSVGPVLRIDISSGRPLMAGAQGYGWLSGAAIKPIILQRIAELRHNFTCPIVGLGGVTTAEDALEMVMGGANLIGICSVAISRGPAIIGRLHEELKQLLDQYNYTHLNEAVGKVQAYLYPEENLGKLEFRYQPELCTRCGRCVRLCPYTARSLSADKEMALDEGKCRYCGFCTSVCRLRALRYTPKWQG